MGMKKFKARYGTELVEHLEMSENENVNLDMGDNFRTVYLTAKEIFYLIGCIRHSAGIVITQKPAIIRAVKRQSRFHQAEGNMPAAASLNFIEELLKGGQDK